MSAFKPLDYFVIAIGVIGTLNLIIPRSLLRAPY